MARIHPYAPMHGIKHNPYLAYAYDKIFNPREADRKYMAMHDMVDMNRFTEEDFNEAYYFIARYGDQGDETVTNPGVLHEHSMLEAAILEWLQRSQKIYDFGRQLTEELAQTDICEISEEDFHLPMNTFYVAIDPETPYTLPNGNILDGFMIIYYDDSDEAVIAIQKNQPGAFATGKTINIVAMQRGGKYTGTKTSYHMGIPLVDGKWDIARGIESRLASEYHANRSLLEEEKSRTGYTTFNEERRRVMEDNKQILIGAMLYLSLYPEKGIEQWPAGAPEKFVRKTQGNKQEQASALQKLSERGWSRSTYYNIESQRSANGGDGNSDRSVATHWRRGHWRKQAFGPNRSERRMTWIRPMLVNASTGELPQHIHIANVGKPKSGKLVQPAPGGIGFE